MSDSLRSMTKWAMATHTTSDSSDTYRQRYVDLSTNTDSASARQRAALNKGHETRTSFKKTFSNENVFENTMLQKVARKLYDGDAPHGLTPMSKKQQSEHILNLQAMHDDHSSQVKIYPQSDKHSSPKDYLENNGLRRAASEFAYRMMPKLSRGKSEARITLNVNPQHAQSVSNAMVQEMKDNPLVSQSKMMGPSNIGTRTDDAILYMGNHSLREANATASSLSKRVANNAFVPHAPFGMEPLSKMQGFSYSEALPHLSSSHGSARKVIVAAAVMDFRKLGGHRKEASDNMEGHVGYHAYRQGFNPNAPAFAVTQAHKNVLADIRTPETVNAAMKAKRVARMLADIRNPETRNAAATTKRVARATGLSGVDASTFRQKLLKIHSK
jgi:hypothetical protein